MKLTRYAGAAMSAAVLCLGGSAYQPPAARPTITLVTADGSLGYAQELTLGFVAGAEAVAGVTHTEQSTAVGDTSAELSDLRALSASPGSGITVFTWNPELMAGSMADAGANGARLIAVHSPPVAASGVTLYVGADDYAMGRMLAEQAAARIPVTSTGTVVVGSAVPGSIALNQRTAGLRDRLMELRPGLRILGPFDTKQSSAAGDQAWEILVRANPTALAFLGTGDSDAMALARMKFEGDYGWLAGGFGDDDLALSAVQAGNFVLVSPEMYLQGAVAGRLQARAAAGDAVPSGWVVTPATAVTPGGVAEIRLRKTSSDVRSRWVNQQVDELLANVRSSVRPLAQAR